MYSSPIVIHVMRARELDKQNMWHIMEEKRSACKVLVGKPEKRRPLKT